jgi:hypothetical protein
MTCGGLRLDRTGSDRRLAGIPKVILLIESSRESGRALLGGAF